MTGTRKVAMTTVLLGGVALAHALATWPLEAAIALFLTGAVLALLGEVLVVRLGWLVHHVGPRVAGVPLYVLPGWTVVIYVALRLALLLTGGWLVAPAAATIATGYDVLADNRGVEQGLWTYTGDGPGPRHRAVPLWNYAG